MGFAHDMGHDIPPEWGMEQDYGYYRFPVGRGVPDTVKSTVEEVVHETERAYLMQLNGKQYWLPKSQIVFDAQKNEVEIPCWLEERLKPIDN